jgi:hypothetical protein
LVFFSYDSNENQREYIKKKEDKDEGECNKVDLRKKEREKDEVEMRSNQIMKKRNTCLEGHHNKSENKEMNREHVFFF